MRPVHEMDFNVDIFAAGDAGRGEAHNDEKQLKVSKATVFHLVAPHDYGHLQDGLKAGHKECLENCEFHSPVGITIMSFILAFSSVCRAIETDLSVVPRFTIYQFDKTFGFTDVS